MLLNTGQFFLIYEKLQLISDIVKVTEQKIKLTSTIIEQQRKMIIGKGKANSCTWITYL